MFASEPGKWREVALDPLTIPFENGLAIAEIVGYPHAGNDVFACRGALDGRCLDFYLKVARHRDADLANEAAALRVLHGMDLPVPIVLAEGTHAARQYLAVSAMPGRRLSAHLAGPEAAHYRSRLPEMLREMGRNLARIHALPILWRPVKARRQHGFPVAVDNNPFRERILAAVEGLRASRPLPSAGVFVHGDHHYANLLWEADAISGVLDWELCGQGWREFDLAWAVVLRPSQTFLTTDAEMQAFLDGYCETAEYDRDAFRWCRALIYCHFLGISDTWEDAEYSRVALSALEGWS